MKLLDIFKKQGGFQLIKRYVRTGSFFTAVVQFVLLGKSRTALEILRLSTQLKTKKWVERKFGKELGEVSKKYDPSSGGLHSKKIWVCWLQGIEDAPIIVKTCFKSLKENIVDREIVLITEENYREYVSFPDFIQYKIDNGIITGAHMTDLLRLELLTSYGGTWIDATVLCTSSDIPSYMLDSDLFMFQCLKPGRDGHSTVVSNWFITASSNNMILVLTLELLYKYWSKNDDVVDYFIFHDIFQIVIEKYPEEWSKVVPCCNSTPHILLLRLFDKYNDLFWNAIKEQTPFHKLSYKFSDDKIKIEDTYYQNIIRLYRVN